MELLTNKQTDPIEMLFCGDGQLVYDEHSNIRHTLIFDPPWDIINKFTINNSDNILAFCDGFRAKDIIAMFGAPTWIFVWDCVSSWYTPNRPLRRMKMCFWYGDISNYKQKGYLYGEPCGKPRMVTNSRGSYMFTPAAGKMLSDVFSSPITRLHRNGGHKHSKPTDWITMLIANTIRHGDIVIDPFAGSGVTLDSCRILGYGWIGCEIDRIKAIDITTRNQRDNQPDEKQLRIFD